MLSTCVRTNAHSRAEVGVRIGPAATAEILGTTSCKGLFDGIYRPKLYVLWYINDYDVVDTSARTQGRAWFARIGEVLHGMAVHS